MVYPLNNERLKKLFKDTLRRLILFVFQGDPRGEARIQNGNGFYFGLSREGKVVLYYYCDGSILPGRAAA
jgi:hypothetical protein